MFSRRVLAVGLASLGLIATGGCGKAPDLTKITLLPGISGYYDDGVSSTGENRLVPSVTFQLRNDGDLPLTNIDLSVSFWAAGKDGEADSKEIRAIKNTPVEPGATGESITVRSGIGYTSPYARADFFVHSQFLDFTVKVFAKHRGRTVKLGEILVDRRVLPAASRNGSRP